MKLNNGITVLSIPDMSCISGEVRLRWNKWIEALEGEKYTQTCCRLRNGNGFCCLGVVQDILKDELGCRWEDRTFADMEGPYRSYSSLILPALRALGMEMSCGFKVHIYDGVTSDRTWGLDQLNDSGANFKEIAGVLRAALSGGLTNEVK